MKEDEKAQHQSEYEALLALYIALLRALRTDNREEAFMELCKLRTEHAFNHVLNGLGVDYDYAITLMKNGDDANMTRQDRELLKRLEAAIANLIDFSVCEEYQLYSETLDFLGDDEIDFNSDEYEELLLLCEKYNDHYAAVENADIAYAGAMAAMWMRLSAGDYVVYWTQNDAKVRPWHMALQGYTASADEFPSWMIPPIDYNCRCFLKTLEAGFALGKIDKVKNAAKDIKKPKQLSDVYSESLAKCGRIFGPSHSYFQVKEKDVEFIKNTVTKIKSNYAS